MGIPGVCEEYGGDLTAFATPIVDTLRVLFQAQTDSDLDRLMYLYRGPPAGAEYLLLQHSNFTQVEGAHHENKLAYFFVVAVSLYGKGDLQWENLIRRLIRQGMDLHVHTRRRPFIPLCQDDHGYAYFHVTPLDELFVHTDSPFEAHKAACNWLGLLASEGLDITAYLEQEAVLHSAQQQSTCARFHQHRKLIFQLGEKPHVWWDWHIDPSSGASAVRDEYKSLVFSHDADYWDSAPWLNAWPFFCSQWFTEGTSWYLAMEGDASKKNQIKLKQKRKEELAASRAYRRLKKRAADLRRASRTNYTSKMPGAWPV